MKEIQIVYKISWYGFHYILQMKLSLCFITRGSQLHSLSIKFIPQSLIIQQFSYYKPLLQNQISTHIISLLASINPLQWICCCSLFFLFVMDEIRFVMILISSFSVRTFLLFIQFYVVYAKFFILKLFLQCFLFRMLY